MASAKGLESHSASDAKMRCNSCLLSEVVIVRLLNELERTLGQAYRVAAPDTAGYQHLGVDAEQRLAAALRQRAQQGRLFRKIGLGHGDHHAALGAAGHLERHA